MIAVRPMILAAVLLAAPGIALAAPRDDAAAAIARCGAYADNRTYLDCIYGAVQPLRASLGLSPALPGQTRLVPPSGGAQAYVPPAAYQPPPPSAAAQGVPAPQDGGGLNFFGDALHMTAYSFDKRGLVTVTLTNGQVWRQVASDTNFAQLGARASDYYVSLDPAPGGRAKMTIRGSDGILTMQQIR